MRVLANAIGEILPVFPEEWLHESPFILAFFDFDETVAVELALEGRKFVVFEEFLKNSSSLLAVGIVKDEVPSIREPLDKRRVLFGRFADHLVRSIRKGPESDVLHYGGIF